MNKTILAAYSNEKEVLSDSRREIGLVKKLTQTVLQNVQCKRCKLFLKF